MTPKKLKKISLKFKGNDNSESMDTISRLSSHRHNLVNEYDDFTKTIKAFHGLNKDDFEFNLRLLTKTLKLEYLHTEVYDKNNIKKSFIVAYNCSHRNLPHSIGIRVQYRNKDKSTNDSLFKANQIIID